MVLDSALGEVPKTERPLHGEKDALCFRDRACLVMTLLIISQAPKGRLRGNGAVTVPSLSSAGSSEEPFKWRVKSPNFERHLGGAVC